VFFVANKNATLALHHGGGGMPIYRTGSLERNSGVPEKYEPRANDHLWFRNWGRMRNSGVPEKHRSNNLVWLQRLAQQPRPDPPCLEPETGWNAKP
jgi:hypothetical protein